MKKIFLIVFVLIGAVDYKSQAQSVEDQLAGQLVTFSIRARDWALVRGLVDPQDSLAILYSNRSRDTIRAANPTQPYNSLIRFSNMPAILVYKMYVLVEKLEARVYKKQNAGTSINTQLKAIVNTPLQNALTAFDNDGDALYQAPLIRGKNFFID